MKMRSDIDNLYVYDSKKNVFAGPSLFTNSIFMFGGENFIFMKVYYYFV